MISHNRATEPTVLGAIWRNRWVVILGSSLGLLVALVLALTSSATPEYVAAATVELVDASRASLFADSSGQTSDRFVSNQLLIFRSSGVASRAADLAVDDDGRSLFTPAEVMASSTVLVQPGTEIVTVLFAAENEPAAIAGANAIAAAYQEIKEQATEETAAAALERVDAALASVDSEIQALGDQIAAYNPNLAEIGARIEVLVNQLLTVQAEIDTATGSAAEEAAERLRVLTVELQSLQLAQSVYDSDPGLTSLLQEQNRLIDWSLQLTTRRLELEIDQQQAASGIGTLSLARSAQPSDSNVTRIVGLGFVIGSLMGAGAAYLLATSRRVVTESTLPEVILKAPLLGEVPDFAADSVDSLLPVRDAPRSASAEAYRFVTTSMEARLQSLAGERVAVVSSETGDGKSVIVANTALSAAYGGRRVLIIDADFGNQSVGGLFGVGPRSLGLTDVVGKRVDLSDAIRSPVGPDNAAISYLGRGTLAATAPDFFRRRECLEFFESLKTQFDLILVDTPPLLQVAYGGTITRLCDSVIAVIRHETQESTVHELHQRLSLIGTPLLGYVYNRAPLRSVMTRSDGSMKDVIGDLGHVEPIKRRR